MKFNYYNDSKTGHCLQNQQLVPGPTQVQQARQTHPAFRTNDEGRPLRGGSILKAGAGKGQSRLSILHPV